MQTVPPGVVLTQDDVRAVTKVLALALKTAFALEADKHLDEHPEAVEVRLLQALHDLTKAGLGIPHMRAAANLPNIIDGD